MSHAVIVGGGMTGLSLALALGNLDIDVTVLEPQVPSPPETWPSGFDVRVSALTPASRHLLTHLGAWDIMCDHRVTPYTGMQVWDGEGTGSVEFEAAASGVVCLGHLVENRVTVHGLMRALESSPRVTLRQEALAGLVLRGGRYAAITPSGEVLEADLMIGADGAHSRVREAVGLPVREWSYGQAAIVTTVHCALPHGDVCRQVFTAEGPLAFLPLRDHDGAGPAHVCSIVWSQDQPRAEALMAMTDAAFCEALAAALEHRLGAVSLLDRRVMVPLVQRHAVDYVRDNVVLVGDAAHAIHPLAGQGVNLGFMDVAVLAEEIGAGIARGLPVGHGNGLRRFQRRRKTANLAMMAAMEAFRHGFGRSHWALRLARNEGLSLVDRHSLLKQWIVEHAMGLRGDIPALASAALRVSV